MRREPTLGKILRTTWLLTLAVGLGACGSDTKKTPDAAAPRRLRDCFGSRKGARHQVIEVGRRTADAVRSRAEPAPVRVA